MSYAPHGFPDVKNLMWIFILSAYTKHMVLICLYYMEKEEILKELPNQNHEFLKMAISIYN